MFRVEVHAYCLMDNHYHLLLSTPDGNLNRVMRHINGVYTQRYNRLEKTDGSLFRGRYKAIVVDADAYLLCVSRYIHLNPVAAGMVKKAGQFRWSSYQAYVGKVKAPDWLDTNTTLNMVSARSRQQRYQQFVDGGVDTDTQHFYGKRNQSPIFGRPSFVKKMEKRLMLHREIPDTRRVRPKISIAKVVECTATVFKTEKGQIVKSTRGRGDYNTARGAALYLSRKHAGHALENIAVYFGLASYGSVSGQIHRFQLVLSNNAVVQRLVDQVKRVIK